MAETEGPVAGLSYILNHFVTLFSRDQMKECLTEDLFNSKARIKN